MKRNAVGKMIPVQLRSRGSSHIECVCKCVSVYALCLPGKKKNQYPKSVGLFVGWFCYHRRSQKKNSQVGNYPWGLNEMIGLLIRT